jgi:HK97 gp10 family phage protein
MAQSDVEVTITGAQDLISRLSTLPDKLQKKGAVRASRDAMRVALNAAQAAARKLDDAGSPEAIWRNLALQNSPRQGRREGGVVIRLGVRGGAQFSKERAPTASGNPGGYTWYWRFLELGREGFAAREFLQPALRNNAVMIEGLLADFLELEIVKLTPK